MDAYDRFFYNDRNMWSDENLEDRRLDLQWLYGEAVGDTSVSMVVVESYREELCAIDDEQQRRFNEAIN